LETPFPPDWHGEGQSYAFSRNVFAHDYRALFVSAGWRTVREGRVGPRIWFVCQPAAGTGS
jgi:hypothetical protein